MNAGHGTIGKVLDLGAIKEQQQGVWSSGDYAVIGTTLQIVGERLCEAMDVRPGSRLLDVAAGNGNVSLAAARRFCSVVSTDYVPALLDRGRRRAEAEGLDVEFRWADVENLPFADGEFDYVASSFGVMFAPDQARAAAELARVCRAGGTIGIASWTPEGFVGKLLGVARRFAPPPAGLASPMRWGTDAGLADLFGPLGAHVETRRRTFAFRYRSAEHFVEVFETFYGPIHRIFAGLDAVGRAEFALALGDLVRAENLATDGTVVIPGEYLETVVTPRAARA